MHVHTYIHDDSFCKGYVQCQFYGLSNSILLTSRQMTELINNIIGDNNVWIFLPTYSPSQEACVNGLFLIEFLIASKKNSRMTLNCTRIATDTFLRCQDIFRRDHKSRNSTLILRILFLRYPAGNTLPVHFKTNVSVVLLRVVKFQ